MKNKRILFYILIIVSFITMSVLLSKKLLQNDTFYTIKVGESISKYGVDMKEHFSWISNLVYTYPHWLYDFFIYFLYNIGGFNLLYLSTIVLGFTLLTLMYKYTNKLVANKAISYLLVLVFSIFLHGFFTVRAQMFSYIFLITILYSIEMLRNTKKKRYYCYIFICSLLIANMHLAVWPFIFVLYLPFVTQDLIYIIIKKFNLKFINNYNIEVENSNLKITLLAVLITFITGFMTPNFLIPFTYFINTYKGPSVDYISEHSPLTINDRIEIYAMIFIFIAILIKKNKKVKLRDLFMICGLFLISFMSYRNVSLFFILSIFSFGRLLNNKNSLLIDVIDNRAFQLILFVFFSSTLFVAIKHNNVKVYYSENEYPVKASDYIVQKLDYKNMKLFNKYDYGSYLIFRDIPVFIDSRADLYLKEFNKNCNVFEDYIDIFYNYADVFSSYGVTHILIKNNDKLNYLLKNDDNYKVLYLDSNFTLYQILT